jgi:cell division topological specificity factor
MERKSYAMLGFSFGKTQSASPSKKIAKDRLKNLLLNDRTTCSPQVLDMMRLDVIEIISSYIGINSEELTLQINRTSDAQPTLVVTVPLSENR